jgi:hypothetical protein
VKIGARQLCVGQVFAAEDQTAQRVVLRGESRYVVSSSNCCTPGTFLLGHVEGVRNDEPGEQPTADCSS